MFRKHPRFDSLLRMVPCDLWRALRGRTLWLVGDSQAQVRRAAGWVDAGSRWPAARSCSLRAPLLALLP